MIQERAIIYRVDVTPKVDMVNTQMRIWVVLTDINKIANVVDEASFSELIEKHDLIQNGLEVNLSPMIKRDCLIGIDENEKYSFLNYL